MIATWMYPATTRIIETGHAELKKKLQMNVH